MNKALALILVSLVTVILLLAFTDGMDHSPRKVSTDVTYSPMPDLPKPVLP